MMLANILTIALLSGQIPTAQKSVIWVLGAGQKNLQLREHSDPSFSTEDVKEKLGIDVLRFEREQSVIFVSDDAYPIASFERSISWIKQSVNPSDHLIDPSSESGKELLQYIQSRFFMDSFEYEPGSKPLGTTLGVTITDPNRPELPPQIRQFADNRGVQPATAVPFAGPIDDVTKRAQLQSSTTNLFPNSKFRNELITLSFRSQKPASIGFSELEDCNQLLESLSNDLVILEQEHSNLLRNCITDFCSKLMPGIDPAKKSWKYEDLPPEIKSYLHEAISSTWKAQGFSSQQEAEDYLNSNPSLNVQFSLVVFASFKTPNQPPGTTSGYAQFIKP